MLVYRGFCICLCVCVCLQIISHITGPVTLLTASVWALGMIEFNQRRTLREIRARQTAVRCVVRLSKCRKERNSKMLSTMTFVFPDVCTVRQFVLRPSKLVWPEIHPSSIDVPDAAPATQVRIAFCSK